MREIEEQKKELIKREEKLREIEAKLAKGDTTVLPSKNSTREGSNVNSHRSNNNVNGNSNGQAEMQGNSPVSRRPRRHTGEYEEDEERPKISELVV